MIIMDTNGNNNNNMHDDKNNDSNNDDMYILNISYIYIIHYIFYGIEICYDGIIYI